MIEVTLPTGQVWKVRKLLAKAASNPKLAKDDGGGKYLVYGLSMSPHKDGGGNVCPFASPGCVAGCLSLGGMAWLDSVNAARMAKHVAWIQEREAFLSMLRRELRNAEKLAARQGKIACVRLNVFSDISWEKIGIVNEFPNIVFYDYTKNPKRGAGGWVKSNYYVVFSRSETNAIDTMATLHRGGNVAVVFMTKNPRKWGEGELPKQYLGYPVHDGDNSDLRFLDPQGGVVIALRAKGKSRKDKTGFVVRG